MCLENLIKKLLIAETNEQREEILNKNLELFDVRDEFFHIKHVGIVMEKLSIMLTIDFINEPYEQSCKYNPDIEIKKGHDWSKTLVYMFLTKCKFRLFPEKEYGHYEWWQKMNTLTLAEINRHYKLEPHHPEFFIINKCLIKEFNIIETAIDRLCRNFQINNGSFNQTQMVNNYPISFDEDTLEKYKRYCKEYANIVVETYHDLKRENSLV